VALWFESGYLSHVVQRYATSSPLGTQCHFDIQHSRWYPTTPPNTPRLSLFSLLLARDSLSYSHILSPTRSGFLSFFPHLLLSMSNRPFFSVWPFVPLSSSILLYTSLPLSIQAFSSIHINVTLRVLHTYILDTNLSLILSLSLIPFYTYPLYISPSPSLSLVFSSIHITVRLPVLHTCIFD